MNYFICDSCGHEELAKKTDFMKNCKCGGFMKSRHVSDRIIDAEIKMRLDEVKTRNSNRGTIVEIIQRDSGECIVEKFENHESGTYEKAEQKGTRPENTSTESSEAA